MDKEIAKQILNSIRPSSELRKYNKKHKTKYKIKDVYFIANDIKEIPKCVCGNDMKFIAKTKEFVPCGKCKIKKNYNDKQKEFIKKYFHSNKNEKEKKLLIKNYIKDLKDLSFILSATGMNSKELYDFVNNISNLKCGCSKELKFRNYFYGYSKFCDNVKCEFRIENQLKKYKETTLRKYGVENTFQLEEFKEKAKKTRKERYGAEYSLQKGSSIRDKIFKLNQEKFGSKSPFGNKEIQKKAKKTMLEKYNVLHIQQTHIKNFENFNKEFIEKNFLKDGFLDRRAMAEYFNLNYWSLPSRLEKLNLSYPLSREKMKTQKEIYDFIIEHYKGEVLFNTNKIINNKELDIYLPELNFAIEYNGLMYHSFGKSNYTKFNNFKNIDKYIHLKKTELCEEKEIHLFQIFENEWVDPIKQDIWKSKILIKLHSSKIQKLNARDCEVKIPYKNEVKIFLEQNHLQGFIPYQYAIGLYFKNELVTLATFGKSRFKKDEFELLRFATKKYTIVRGGLSKLIKNSNIKNFISYANRRWVYSKSNIYEKISMKKEKITEPNYFYFKPKENILYNRIKFQKHKLANQLEYFDFNLTEMENMFNNGYRVIFDCGNIKYKFN